MNEYEIHDKEIENVYNYDYFKLSKHLQTFIGLWPYKHGLETKIRRFIVYCDVLITLFPMLNGFRVWCGKDLDICCENIIAIIYLVLVLFKFQVTMLSEAKMKNVYQRVALNWLTMTDPEEKAIIKHYAKLGQSKANAYFIFMVIAGVAFSQLPMIPIVLDIIIPLNESREKIQFVKAEYVIDPMEHYYKLYIHFVITSVITIAAMTSVDVTYTVVTHQNLGIFSIVRYRLKMATLSCDKKMKSDYDKIVAAITLHKEALQFLELIESSYSILFLYLIGGSIVFLSMGAVIGMSNMNNQNYANIARLVLGMVGCLVHMLYLSWPGQMLIDHSEEIFVSIYTNEWYNVSQRSKVLLEILMLKCLKPCTFTAGGLYIMSFENFGAVVKTALTYITAAVSFRN